ncbi:MAG: hypothetical protein ACI87O_002806 [Planctomycetota bacterium]|jgi:hypothetical protein
MYNLRLPSLAVLLVAAGSSASAQHTFFSTDWLSPTVGLPASGSGTPITAGDLLTPAAGLPSLGPLLTPAIAVSHGAPGLGLLPGCVGVPGSTPCRVEVDAVSFGFDKYFTSGLQAAGQLHFSVDLHAKGAVGAPLPPNVTTEGPALDGGGDVFLNPRSIPAGPIGPGAPFGNRGIFDEDGMPSASGYTYPGLGLLSIFGTPAMPDNLDALDTLDASISSLPGTVYFSMDDQGVDPLTGISHTASANTHGFAGADVLSTVLGSGVPTLYAPAGALGLNIVFGFNPDDLDALILRENGDGVFQPSQQPMDWLSGSTDMLLFSVRRGSAVVGEPDSIFGIPIEPGDILTTPLSAAFGGLSPFPGIFYAAERLGLGTIRSGTATSSNHGDDLNALDSVLDVINDCDGDGIEDVVAIAAGLVADTNLDGVPDSCVFTTLCTPLPNSTAVPTLLTGSLGSGVGSGLHLEASQGPPGEFGFFLIGTGLDTPGLSIGSGMLCLSVTSPNLLSRYTGPAANQVSIGIFDGGGIFQNLAGTATSSGGTGFDVPTAIPVPIGGTIATGDTYHFQLWHRDSPSTSNFSNPLTVTF